MLSTLVHPQHVHAMGATGLPRVHPRVDIRIDTASAAGQEVVKGILSYVRSNTAWRVRLPDRGGPRAAVRKTAKRTCDGVLAQIDGQEAADWIVESGVPAVNVCGEHREPLVPLVAADDDAIAEMAVEHLSTLGFRDVAVCGWTRGRSSASRIEAFVRHAKSAGLEALVREATPAKEWEKERDALAAWLGSMPKPVGILACDDALGQQLLDACRAARLAVPADVAVLGVGNDELICGVADPPMSSIVLDNRHIGFEAARRLHRMLEHEVVEADDVPIRPVEVAARPSTDALVVEDQDVAAAASFIRRHALEGIKVADVLAAVPVSRRVLETRFRSYFGRTLHQEILGMQLDNVKQLLRETDLSMSQIADRSGFRHVEYMSVVFKREVGVPPTTYRRDWNQNR